MQKIFTFFRNYAPELILILATCALLGVFHLISQTLDNTWINTIVAAIIPITLLRVLIVCPLERALYRNSDTYIWIICFLAVLSELITTTYPSVWITALIVAEVILMGIAGFLIMAFITVNLIDPYK